MTTDDPSPAVEGSPPPPGTETGRSAGPDKASGGRVTRAGAAWVATAASLALLTLLIVFILQNQSHVELKFFGLTGDLPAGVAMLIAAVSGGILVALSGAVRLLQLRRDLRRMRRRGRAG